MDQSELLKLWAGLGTLTYCTRAYLESQLIVKFSFKLNFPMKHERKLMQKLDWDYVLSKKERT